MNKDLILNEFSRVSQAMGWDSLHSPKNLASAVSIEAAKLLENFQWLTDIESELVCEDGDINKIAGDIADLFIYLNVLSHKLGLEPWDIVKDKMLLNRTKYIEQIVAKDQIVSKDIVQRAAEVYSPGAQPASPGMVRVEVPRSQAGNEAVDWEAVARKIANSRQELEAQSNRLKERHGKDDSHR
ncbi:nucleotide pyrophosphohydrolase [Teredinibacter turnerae]|uniref:nucleotide pyrophosphohydrolase n=1 Tax=Teredinibacter turnerae TaxID=2426 RepID=UPI0003FA3333|nr:nucleotide pyrophosphohydrolase [Teredinibacter turnerae]